jgi:DnaJ-class molecular chaperone
MTDRKRTCRRCEGTGVEKTPRLSYHGEVWRTCSACRGKGHHSPPAPVREEGVKHDAGGPATSP